MPETLIHCICGGCYGCPDGWHTTSEPCGCTPSCLLGDDPCPECELHSVTDGTCKACGAEPEHPEYPCPNDPDGLHSVGCGCDF